MKEEFLNQLNTNLNELFPEELLLPKNKPLVYEFLGTYRTFDKSKFKVVDKLDSVLPLIILPNNKIDMILNWWNETIRFEKTIPKAFESGYIKLDFSIYNKKVILDRALVRNLAEMFNISVYNIKDKFSSFLNVELENYLYFKFLNENTIYFEVLQNIYNSDKMIRSWKGTIKFGESNEEPKIDSIDPLILLNILIKNPDIEESLRLLNEHIGRYYIAILSTILWYITISKSNNTKYIYKETRSKYENKYIDKNIIEPKDIKTITTTIYDFRRIKYVDTNILNRRKVGWTYSHSFEVHGHYRHYKNGKTIFINPYIKGNNKTFKAQKIILNPKEI